jgi:integrase
MTVDGKDITRFGIDKEHAEWLLQCLRLGVDPSQRTPDRGTSAPPRSLTFSEVINRFSKSKVTKPVYRGDKKVSGLRSHRTVKLRLEVLREALGDVSVREITPSVIEEFRQHRLNTPTQYNRERSIADVNRCVELLNSVLLWAEGELLIERAPSAKIERAHESRRTRTLSPDEEKRLLAACDTPKRRQLKPLIIFALETGARPNEMKQVRWCDVSLKTKTITLRATTTKTLQQRTLPLSDRLKDVLIAMPSGGAEETKPTDHIFEMTTWQKSWNAACKAAKIEGLRFYDLRATFITRMIQAGLPAEIVAKISGHSTVDILFKHYLRTDKGTLDAVRDVLNQRRP